MKPDLTVGVRPQPVVRYKLLDVRFGHIHVADLDFRQALPDMRSRSIASYADPLIVGQP